LISVSLFFGFSSSLDAKKHVNSDTSATFTYSVSSPNNIAFTYNDGSENGSLNSVSLGVTFDILKENETRANNLLYGDISLREYKMLNDVDNLKLSLGNAIFNPTSGPFIFSSIPSEANGIFE
jgi:hypothetical protein